MASVYSGIGEGRYGVVPIRGEVEFGLQYNYKAGDVEIHVKRCSDLAPVDQKRNRSDPYVKVYLLPDKSKSGKRKTRVKKHTLNPVFDEVLKYHVTLEELESRILWLSVWHSDIFGRNDFLGEVVVPLVNKVFDDPSPKIYVLKERSEILDNVSAVKGELIVALKFVLPTEDKSKKENKEIGSLHVLVKEAKNLVAAKSNGSSDPFCKSYLLPNKGRTCKQKTPILKRTCHPVWNHTFVYNNITLDELTQRCLELTIWDHDRLGSNELLGGVRLSLGTGSCNDKSVDWMDSNNREVALWQRMIDHQNFWVESSLILRSSLDVRAKN